MTVSSYRGVDERWIQGGEGFIVERVFLKRTGEVVFDEDVTFLDEGMENVDAGGIVEGEAEGLFVAVYLSGRIWLEL